VSAEIVEVRLEQLVEDVIGGLHRMYVADPRLVSRSAIELFDVGRAQVELHVVGDRSRVHPREALNRELLGPLPKGGLSVEQLIKQLGLLRRCQCVQCRCGYWHPSSTRW
jgi:hypothetical protein